MSRTTAQLSSTSQLVALNVLTEIVADTLVVITSHYWKKQTESWQVPLQLLDLSTNQIFNLVAAVTLHVTDTTDRQEPLEEDYANLIAVGTSHAVLKYWMYLRMLYYYNGRADDHLVWQKICVIEKIHDMDSNAGQQSYIVFDVDYM